MNNSKNLLVNKVLVGDGPLSPHTQTRGGKGYIRSLLMDAFAFSLFLGSLVVWLVILGE